MIFVKANQSRHETEGAMKYLKPILLGVALGAVVITLLLMILSLLMSLQDIPQSFITPMVLFSLGVGAFAGGLFAARLTKEKGLLLGAGCGLLLFAAIWVCGLGLNPSVFGALTSIKLLIAVVLASLGGVVGINGKKRRK